MEMRLRTRGGAYFADAAEGAEVRHHRGEVAALEVAEGEEVALAVAGAGEVEGDDGDAEGEERADGHERVEATPRVAVAENDGGADGGGVARFE